jgi:carbon storage regulator
MLVFSRKLNESFQIGGNVRVTIVRVNGDVVRVGIEAPDDVRVFRTELLTEAGAVSGREASFQEASF